MIFKTIRSPKSKKYWKDMHCNVALTYQTYHVHNLLLQAIMPSATDQQYENNRRQQTADWSKVILDMFLRTTDQTELYIHK